MLTIYKFAVKYKKQKHCKIKIKKYCKITNLQNEILSKVGNVMATILSAKFCCKNTTF